MLWRVDVPCDSFGQIYHRKFAEFDINAEKNIVFFRNMSLYGLELLNVGIESWL